MFSFIVSTLLKETASYAAQNVADLTRQGTQVVMSTAAGHIAAHAGTACAGGAVVGLVAASPVVAGALVAGGVVVAAGALYVIADELSS